MKVNRTWMLTAALTAVLAAPLKAIEPGADGKGVSLSASTQDQLDKMDQGLDHIDVSSYPKKQQAEYLVFASKCSKCHTLARPINSPYVLPQEWKAYVEKMRHKSHSGIDEASAGKIIDFLVYDSSIRKKDLLAAKLKKSAASERLADTGDKKVKTKTVARPLTQNR